MTTFTLNQIVLNSVLTAVQSVFGSSIRGVTRNWEDKIIVQLKKEIEKMNRNRTIKPYYTTNGITLKVNDINVEYFEMTNSPDFSIFTFNNFVVILDWNAKSGNLKMNVVYAGDLSNHNYVVDRLTQYKKAMDKYNGCVPGKTSWYK